MEKLERNSRCGAENNKNRTSNVQHRTLKSNDKIPKDGAHAGSVVRRFFEFDVQSWMFDVGSSPLSFRPYRHQGLTNQKVAKY
jgi:hypothetical protein